jgi:hypothetical protein
MIVEKASFGHLVFLMPEEQKYPVIIETIEKLKEAGKVAIFISGYEKTQDTISRLIKSCSLSK